MLWDALLSRWKLGRPLLLDERVAHGSHWLTLWEPSLVKDPHVQRQVNGRP